MKRRLDNVLSERDTGTPRTSPGKSMYPMSGRTSKRQRALRALINSTPSGGTPQVPTPDSIRARQACYEPSTAERKLAGFTLDSPILGVTQVPPSKTGRKSELTRFSQTPASACTVRQSPTPSFGACVPHGETLPAASASRKEISDSLKVAATSGEDEDEEVDDDDEGYFIRSSQSYSRLSSQVCEPCNTPGEQIKQVNLLAQDSQETQQSHFSFPNPATEPSQPSSVEPCLAPPEPLSLGGVATAAAAAANITPEFNDSTTNTSVAEEAGGTHMNEEECSAPKLFPIFRPRFERKTLLIIRHGESEYNKAAAEGRALADPNIFDPKLTPTGHRQALALKGQLQEYMKKHGEALWLMSPLTRCIETFIDACPCLDRVCPSPGPGPKPAPLNIHVLSSISEHVASTGDVGRPKSALVKDFPLLSSQLQQLNDCWWVSHEDKPNCAINKVFATRETRAQLKKRVDSFASWLGKRPEKLVIAFGHSTFWKEFTKAQTRMKNGELKVYCW